MADNDQLLKQIGDLIDTKLDEKLDPVKTQLSEQGKKLDGLQADVNVLKSDMNTVKDFTAHTNTTLKALATKQDVDAAKTELRKEIIERQRPRKAD